LRQLFSDSDKTRRAPLWRHTAKYWNPGTGTCALKKAGPRRAAGEQYDSAGGRRGPCRHSNFAGEHFALVEQDYADWLRAPWQANSVVKHDSVLYHAAVLYSAVMHNTLHNLPMVVPTDTLAIFHPALLLHDQLLCLTVGRVSPRPGNRSTRDLFGDDDGCVGAIIPTETLPALLLLGEEVAVVVAAVEYLIHTLKCLRANIAVLEALDFPFNKAADLRTTDQSDGMLSGAVVRNKLLTDVRRVSIIVTVVANQFAVALLHADECTSTHVELLNE